MPLVASSAVMKSKTYPTAARSLIRNDTRAMLQIVMMLVFGAVMLAALYDLVAHYDRRPA